MTQRSLFCSLVLSWLCLLLDWVDINCRIMVILIVVVCLTMMREKLAVYRLSVCHKSRKLAFSWLLFTVHCSALKGCFIFWGWQPCPLWEPSPSHPILLYTRGFAVFCVYVCFLYVCSFSTVLWYCWLGLLTCNNCLPYNLYCVGRDVKHCSVQSNSCFVRATRWRWKSVAVKSWCLAV